MKPYEYDLNLLYVFHEIVRTGSLSAAGRKLRISRSGVSQKLKALENSIGTQLIRRSTRDIDLTGSGQCLFDHCRGIFEQLDTAERQLSGLKNEMQGHIRLCVPTSLGQDYFNSVMIDFIKENPNTSFTIIFSNRIKNFLSSEIDVALQITTIDNIPQDYVAREIGVVPWCICAAPGFLETVEPITLPRQLAALPFITPTYTVASPKLTVITSENTTVHIPLTLRVQSESLPFLRDNVIGGQGIGLLPVYSIKKELDDASLVRLLPDCQIKGFGDRLYVISTQTFHMTQLQRRFIDFVIRKLRRMFA